MVNNANPIINFFDNDTITLNDRNVIGINQKVPISIELLNLPNLSYNYTSPTTTGIQFAANGYFNPFINFDTSSNEFNIMMSSNTAGGQSVIGSIYISIDNDFQNYINISQGSTGADNGIALATDGAETLIELNSYAATNAGFIFNLYETSAGKGVNILTANSDYFKSTVPVWDSAKNRVYQQNLTAATTTSTTMVLLGSINSITPKFSGHIIITAELRISNNTLSDGVSVELLNGSTVLDTETDTQEGLASNEHSLVFHYELTSQTVGTALSISLNFAAVTGGTASAKIVSFICEEI